jgi:hypothetical protein
MDAARGVFPRRAARGERVPFLASVCGAFEEVDGAVVALSDGAVGSAADAKAGAFFFFIS